MIRGAGTVAGRAPRRRLAADDPVGSLPGVGPVRAGRLARLGIRTVGDCLGLLPRRYEDRRQRAEVVGLAPGRVATFEARVREAGRRGRVFRAVLEDGTGRVGATWFRFRGGHLRALLAPGARVLVHGRPEGEPGNLELLHPEVEPLGRADEGPGLRPVYPATAGLAQATIRRVVRAALEALLPGMRDPLPASMRAALVLPDAAAALEGIHRPGPEARVEELEAQTTPFHRRLAFGELLALQLALGMRRRARDRGGARRGRGVPATLLERFRERLPFELTPAQERACRQIVADLDAARPMERLLHGEVASGKTVVAAFAAAAAIGRGGQAAVMAPTELLAEQLARVLRGLREAVGAEASLLTGSTARAERAALRGGLANGSIALVVGTHALLGEGVRFARLGLAVVDEQHRFGVRQRLGLGAKAGAPDLLVMSATPIPRSLALALYGDLEVSVLDQVPPGRAPVRTRVVGEGERGRVRGAVGETLALGGRVLVVCPLAEDGGAEDPPAVGRTARRVRREHPGVEVGVAHARLGHLERARALERFRSGEAPVLVATTIVEVGIDVPEAALVVVEGAERFGLAQLHQIRGRVGRGRLEGRCLLVAGEPLAPGARERLDTLARTADGFAVAEADLRLRGPGRLLGHRQSGPGGLRFADLGRDLDLLLAAREEARALLDEDPELSRPDHLALRRAASRAVGSAGGGAGGGGLRGAHRLSGEG